MLSIKQQSFSAWRQLQIERRRRIATLTLIAIIAPVIPALIIGIAATLAGCNELVICFFRF